MADGTDPLRNALVVARAPTRARTENFIVRGVLRVLGRVEAKAFDHGSAGESR